MEKQVKRVRPTRIGRVKAAELIGETKGRFFTATFIKKDGAERKMTCRLGVVKGIKANPKRKAPDTKALGIINVYDVQEKNYKKLNLQTIISLKTKGTEYKVS